MQTSPLICYANQLAGFYMIEASITKELKRNFLKENKKPSLTVIKTTIKDKSLSQQYIMTSSFYCHP